MRTVTFSEACENLEAVIDRVSVDQEPVLITRDNDQDIVMVSAHEWSGMKETLHLMASPANAKHLIDGVARLDTEEAAFIDHEDCHLADHRLRNFCASDAISLAAIKTEPS